MTGDEYEVFINNGHFYRDTDGVWKPAATDSSISAAKQTDCSESTITATAFPLLMLEPQTFGLHLI